MRKMNKLINEFPDIWNELDKKSNSNIDLNSLQSSSNKEVYWTCKLGHLYKMPVYKRTGKDKCGCPYCSNRKVLKGFNDLETKYKDLVLEWDYSLNKDAPDKYVYGSSHKVNWICQKCNHKWQTSIRNRTLKGTGCPECSKKENAKKRHLQAILDNGGISNELLLAEWDYERNNILLSECSEGSQTLVFWKCSKCGYVYKAKVNNRAKLNSGCPLCANKVVVKGVNDLLTTHPKIAAEWDYDKNEKTPDQITYGNGKKVWWKCPNGHSYQATTNHRTSKMGTNCPICFKGRQTSFAEQAFYFYIKKVYPDAINSYRDIFNNGMELDIYIPSIRLGIEYDGEAWHKESNFERELKKFQICQEHNIKLIRLKEKRYDNDYLTANTVFHIDEMYKPENLYKAILYIISEISPETNIWTRKRFDKWYTSLDINISKDENEIRNYMTELSSDSLIDKYPELAKEWNIEKNSGLTPKMFKPGSDKKIWWTCSKCHSDFEASIYHRVKGSGCPKCGITKSALKRSKGVKMIDIETNEVIRYFDSISEASRMMNISSGNISTVLKGKRNHTKGYKWEYIE